jgi:protein phosphatase
MHRKEIIHQDLKLDNIMFRSDRKPVVIDYGSCRIESFEAHFNRIDNIKELGTIDFSAPEVRLGISQSISVKSDQFSIAMIAYTLLTGGEFPYGDKWLKAKNYADFGELKYIPAFDHRSAIPSWLDGALKKALHVDPDARYSSLSEFIMDLKKPNQSYNRSRHMPLIERDPVLFWQLLSALLFLIILGFLWHN